MTTIFERFTLNNLHNSCYLNSAIQLLWSIPGIYKALLQENDANGTSNTNGTESNYGTTKITESTYGTDKSILFQLSRIAKSMAVHAKENRIITFDIVSFHYNFLKKSQMQIGSQEDANEALLQIISSIEQVNTQFWRNFLKPTITFKQITSTVCAKCNYTSTNNSELTELQLHFDSNYDSNCASNLSKEITFNELMQSNLETSVSWRCDRCNETSECNKRFDYACDNTALIVQLCRFSYIIDPRSKQGKFVKNKIAVSMPNSIQFGGKQWEFTAMVIHSGNTVNSGHYHVVIAPNLQIDDNSIEQINEKQMKKQCEQGYIALFSRK